MRRRVSVECPNLISHEDLPDIHGDVESVLAEMEAQRVFFDASLGLVSSETVSETAIYALRVRSQDESLIDRLTTFCLWHSVGRVKFDLIPHRWSRSTRWAKRTTEDLITSWMRWVAHEDTEAVTHALHRMERDREDASIEALPLQYWATAIQALTQSDQLTSKRFFERAMEVSSQFGFPSNPPICWTYALSFLPREPLCV